MNKPTLNDFLFSLNQDEDILVKVVDFDSDEILIERTWKSGLHYTFKDEHDKYKDWFVQDFIVTGVGNICLEITISKEDSDND